MADHHSGSIAPQMPSLRQLGSDLLQVTWLRQLITLGVPFVAMAGYFLFAALRWWPLAVISVMVLSFVTYGSSSHDLVHRTLRLPRSWNHLMLSFIELLSLRSGTAYRLSHLHHHRRLLAEDDIEGSAAYGTLVGAILGGIITQPRLWIWAWRKYAAHRPSLFIEAAGIVIMLAAAALALRWTPVPMVYVVLVIGGSWLFPLVTVYLPHDRDGQTTLLRTRLFRGRLVQLVAFDHLYHLEHHLYPAVPHHNWRLLATRLDPHFRRAGVTPLCGKIPLESDDR